MSDDQVTEEMIAGLRAVAADPGLPDTVCEQALSLAERMERGVCIVLMGPKASGKSALCDAIFARHSFNAPSCETRVFARQEPMLADIPLETLRFVPDAASPFGLAQVIDLHVPEDFETYEDLVGKGLDFADIVLWCTQSFEPEETALWADACDALKDHSFLVLTKADRLAEEGVLQDRIATLSPIVSEEFHSILPVTTSLLCQAHADSQPVSDAQLAASGVKALLEAVTRIVHSGQSADKDSALLLLERHGQARYEARQYEVDASVGTLSQNANCDIQKVDRFNAARDVLMQRAYDLAELGFDDAEDNVSDVLELCSEISVDFVDQLRDDCADHPELEPWCLAFEEASDKITLMAMENDTRSAADAVTILLQLRRDMDQMSIR